MDRMIAGRWVGSSDQPSPGDREFIGLSDIAQFLRRYLLSITAWAAAGILCAGFYVATTDSIFTASTQVLIEPKLSQLVQQQTADVNLSLDTAQIESQIAVMQSEKIATMVIEKLKLKENPDFNRPRSPTLAQRLWKLKARIAAVLGSQVEPSSAGDTAAALSEFERNRLTMGAFQAGLDISRVGVSYAIDISFSSRDPDLSAKIANATAEAFVREQIETKAEAARQGGRWLESRLAELRTQMNTATQVEQEFRARHDYDVGHRLGAKVSGGQVIYEEHEGAAEEGPTLEELEVTADTYRKMYESFLQAYTNSVSRQSYPVADARVITAASPPLSASQPKKKLVLALGALAGLMAGVGLSFVRVTLDRTIRSPVQVRDELGIDCIGELPPVKRRLAGRELTEAGAGSGRASRYWENLRRLMTAIALADTVHPVRCLGVTSARPGEGKSTVAGNLATLYSASGMRTLAVDADTFRSALTRSFIPGAESGTTPTSAGSLSSLIVPAANGFDVLPSAASDARKLLVPKNLQAALAELQDYDMIVVDLPPLVSGADRLMASSLLDGVVIVAEWGKTPIDTLADLIRSMRASKATVIGLVMTNVRMMSKVGYRRLGTWRPD